MSDLDLDEARKLAEAVPTKGGWICDQCDSEADDEHAPCSCDGDRDDLLDEIGKLRQQVKWIRAERDAVESRTVAAIADWLERCDPRLFSRRDYGTQNVDDALFASMTRMLADALRAGRWKP